MSSTNMPTRKPESTEQFLAAISKGKHRKGAGGRLRKLVAERELEAFGGLYCYCCGSAVSRGSATIEHILPKSLGGRDVLDNMALSHETCNKARGNNYTPRAAIAKATGSAQ
jgi:5-methylcytosine-specific restriction endonuclease McrA